MSWICKHCENDVDDDFDICWFCGATFDGEKNPHFFPEIDATELPTDGSRLICCANCGYRGTSGRVQAVGGFVSGLFSLVFGIHGASKLTNHACPECGETRQVYDWKA